ncbi:hypothetical protein [Oculatella sp. LEGE 06141]|uniref:hypothetical protein n=1 Tax=Oculatella sp. LEGE 06141 TaxID=1828648 RepID=UPI001D133708|nr:hypothetical protein [Oculatella sp. LEGE 06141]
MMTESVCTVPVPRTQQELEQAVHDYQTTDLSGFELFCYWQAIREASLEQGAASVDRNPILGDDSY